MSDVLNFLRSKLYDYQFEALLALISYLQNYNGNPLLCLPTATGKSYVNAAIGLYVVATYPNRRVLFLTHVKNLIEQNLEKLLLLWPNAPHSVFSAGLNQRNAAASLVFGGIASVVKNLELFGHFDIIVIDEAHLVSLNESSMYQLVINHIRTKNPHVITVGLTATPFRIGQGKLTEGTKTVKPLFTDIPYDLTGIVPFRRFIDENKLCPLVPTATKVEIDTSSIKIINGDFAKNQLDDATEKLLFDIVSESVTSIRIRNSGIMFCSGIKTSEHAAEMLQSFGISAAAIHSKLSDEECDKRFAAFKKGELQIIVGNNKFTTGFDFPPIDIIIMARPTMSPGLWVQMLGRGTRVYDFTKNGVPGFDYVKYNCLVLDFASNCKRLGPINDPIIPKKKGEAVGEAPIKICEACGIYNHSSARYCGGKPYASAEGCGAEFQFKTKLLRTAGTDELIAGLDEKETVIETFNVDRVIYHKHTKIGSEPSLKVSYFVGLTRYTEYQCFQHKGFARTRAISWWQQRHNSTAPSTVDEALLYVSQLRVPKFIQVCTSEKYPQIIGVNW